MPMWVKGQRIWADKEHLIKEMADNARLSAGQRPNNSKIKDKKPTKLDLDLYEELIKDDA